MPKGWIRGPQGQLRPAHPGGAVVRTMKIALGEIEEVVEKPPLPPGDGRLREALRRGEPVNAYGPGLPLPPRPRRFCR